MEMGNALLSLYYCPYALTQKNCVLRHNKEKTFIQGGPVLVVDVN